MADTKISALTAIDAIATGDLLAVVDDPGGTPSSKKVTVDQAKTFVLTTPLAVVGNATAGAELRLPEDTDNGSHYAAIKAPDSLAASYTLTLPTDDGTSGQYLKTDGSGGLSWDTPAGGSGSPGGSDTQVQFNDGGAFGGVSGFTFDKTNKILAIASASGQYALDITTTGTNQPGIRIVNGVDTLTLGSNNQYYSQISATYALRFTLGDFLAIGGQSPGSGFSSLPDQNGLNMSRRAIVFSRHAAYTGVAGTYTNCFLAIDIHQADDQTQTLNILGQDAFPTAVTNLDGGDIRITGGAGASSSAGDADGGNVYLKGGTGYGTGSNGFIILQNVPTSSSGLPSGAIWSNSGVLTIV
jgi:hypothetical protein